MTMPALAYDADPVSDKPALLLIHGLLSSRRHWLVNSALSQDFRLIRVELPGHGQSPPPQEPDGWQPARIVHQLETLRQRIGLARWHVCGQSFGAGLALRYALDFPESCQTICFTNANAALRGAWGADELQAQADLADRLRAGGPEAVAKLRYHPAQARRFPPDIRAMLVEDATRVSPQTIARLLQSAVPELSVLDRLHQLRPPCLLINGIHEKRFQSARNALAAHFPAIAITDLPGGHSVNIECPQGFDAALTSFVLGSEGKTP